MVSPVSVHALLRHLVYQLSAVSRFLLALSRQIHRLFALGIQILLQPSFEIAHVLAMEWFISLLGVVKMLRHDGRLFGIEPDGLLNHLSFGGATVTPRSRTMTPPMPEGIEHYRPYEILLLCCLLSSLVVIQAGRI